MSLKNICLKRKKRTIKKKVTIHTIFSKFSGHRRPSRMQIIGYSGNVEK